MATRHGQIMRIPIVKVSMQPSIGVVRPGKSTRPFRTLRLGLTRLPIVASGVDFVVASGVDFAVGITAIALAARVRSVHLIGWGLGIAPTAVPPTTWPPRHRVITFGAACVRRAGRVRHLPSEVMRRLVVLSLLAGLLLPAPVDAAKEPICNGTTDTTMAIQAALDALTSKSALNLPAGVCRISAPLMIPKVSGKRIAGVSWGGTVILQTTPGVPIFRATAEDTHSISFERLVLRYSRQSTSAETDAIGLAFWPTATATGHGFYYWRVSEVTIEGANTGISLAGSGPVALWSSSFDGIRFFNTARSAIRLVSPVAIGMPVSVWRDIKIVNDHAAVQASDRAIRGSGAELQFDGLDVEGWHDQILYVDGGAPVTLRGVHVEHHQVKSDGSILFLVSDNALTIEDAVVQFTSSAGWGVRVARSYVGGMLDLRHWWVDASGSGIEFYSADPASGPLYFRDIQGTGIAVPQDTAPNPTP